MNQNNRVLGHNPSVVHQFRWIINESRSLDIQQQQPQQPATEYYYVYLSWAPDSDRLLLCCGGGTSNKLINETMRRGCCCCCPRESPITSTDRQTLRDRWRLAWDRMEWWDGTGGGGCCWWSVRCTSPERTQIIRSLIVGARMEIEISRLLENLEGMTTGGWLVHDILYILRVHGPIFDVLASRSSHKLIWFVGNLD